VERGAPLTMRRDLDWARRLTRFFSKADPRVPEVVTAATGNDSKSPNLPTEALFLSVASGKGGTGKSFFATNLAVAMCSQHRRVTLVDCDFGMANDHLLLGVNPAQSIQHFFAGTTDIAQVCVHTRFGPDLLPGGSGISRLGDLSEMDLLRLGEGLGTVAASADIMLMDSAAGISPQSVVTLLAAQYVLIVTNPEIAALTDAYALIKCIASHPGHGEILVVVNRAATEAQGEATFDRLADVSARFSSCAIHYLGAIPEEPAVSHHRLNQPPLVVSHAECHASQAIFEVLNKLEQHVGVLGPRQVREKERVEHRFRKNLSRSRRHH
jgi:flagellar biosynthesis protein FlhG